MRTVDNGLDRFVQSVQSVRTELHGVVVVVVVVVGIDCLSRPLFSRSEQVSSRCLARPITRMRTPSTVRASRRSTSNSTVARSKRILMHVELDSTGFLISDSILVHVRPFRGGPTC